MPTEDIAAHLGRIKADRVVVGFALEDHDHQRHAEEKLQRKNCDAIVLNSLSNIGADEGEIQILKADTGWQPPIRGSKKQLVAAIVELTEAMMAGRTQVSS